MKSTTICIVFALISLMAVPCAAEWLVTRDGARIEIKGPWKVEGRRVIFTLPNGTLSAMRASEIDFEASEEASRPAPPPPPPAAPTTPPPRPEPVLVLTNKDIPQADLGDPDAPPRPEVLPSIADREPVQVINWQRIDAEEGVELRGTVRNTGSSVAANISVRAEVKDEDGEVVGTGNAFLGNSSLVSGRSTTFRIVLPEVDDFTGDPSFTVSSSRLTIGGAAVERGAAGEEDEGAAGGAAGAAAGGAAELPGAGGGEPEGKAAEEDDIKP